MKILHHLAVALAAVFFALAGASAMACAPLHLHDFTTCRSENCDATPGYNALIAALPAHCSRTAMLGKGRYRMDSQPVTVNFTVNLVGEGPNSEGTVFVRNFNGATGKGLLDFEGAAWGSKLEGVFVVAASGTSGGGAVWFRSTASDGISNLRLRDLYLTAYGYNAFDHMLMIDGSQKVGGALGARVVNIQNVIAFGTRYAPIWLRSLNGGRWVGGGIYQGGSGDSSQLIISGTAASKSNGVVIDIESAGSLSMVNTAGARVTLLSLGSEPDGNSVFADGTVSGARVHVGAMSGIVQPGPVDGNGNPTPPLWIWSSVATEQ